MRHTLQGMDKGYGTVALLSGMLLTGARTPAGAQVFDQQTLTHVPTSVGSLALNDNGWAAWTTGQGSGSQVYVYDGAAITPLGAVNGNNRDVQINNNNIVVWDAYKPASTATNIYQWQPGGTATSLTNDYITAAQPTINDNNDVAWWGQKNASRTNADVFYLAHGASQATNLTQFDAAGSSSGPRLNNNGRISWERSTGNPTSLRVASVANPSQFTQIAIDQNGNLFNGGINSAGALVWRQYSNAQSKWDVWKYDTSTGLSRNLSAGLTGNSFDPMIAANGTVVWHTDSATQSALYWDRGTGAERIPITTSLNFTRPVALNDDGQLLFVTGNGTGTGFDIILATPQAVPAPSAWFVTGLGLLTGLARLRRARPRRA